MKAAAFCLAVLALAACGQPGPVAEDANDSGTAEIGVHAANGGVPVNAAGDRDAAEASPGLESIPSLLHGRWGLTPADCEAGRSDAKGLMTVSAEEIRFYESVARPVGGLERSGNSVRGQFAFTGEGMSWTRFEAFELQDGKLVRTESDPMASFTYVRCTG